MKKFNVSINSQLVVRVCYETEVEAENEDRANDLAWDEIKELPLGELDVRDCTYSDDEIRVIE